MMLAWSSMMAAAQPPVIPWPPLPKWSHAHWPTNMGASKVGQKHDQAHAPAPPLLKSAPLLGNGGAGLALGSATSNKTFCNPVNLAYRMHVRRQPLLPPQPLHEVLRTQDSHPACRLPHALIMGMIDAAGQVPRRCRLHNGAVERHVLALHHRHAGRLLAVG